jgi:hypothetical protein
LWVMRRNKIATVCLPLVKVCRRSSHWYRSLVWKLSTGSYDPRKSTVTVASLNWLSLNAAQTNQPSSTVSYGCCVDLACRDRKIALLSEVILDLFIMKHFVSHSIHKY